MFATVNVGTVDRAFRAAVGLVLVLLPFMFDLLLWTNPVAKWASVVVGAVLITTALSRFCPLYRLLGASTCRTTVG